MTPPRLKPIMHEANVATYGDPSGVAYWDSSNLVWTYDAGLARLSDVTISGSPDGHVLHHDGTWRDKAIGSVVEEHAPPWPAIIAGNWYGPHANSDVAMIADRLYLVPIFIPASVTIDDIAIAVALASTAGTEAELGIYSFDRTTLIASGTTSTAITGARIVSISASLTLGAYWLAALFESTPTVTGVNRNVSIETGLGYGSAGATIIYPCLYGAQAWASGLPSDASGYNTQSTTAANFPPAVRVRT